MQILSMKLENFQGIKNLEITPEGKTVSIFGDNGTGKTTIYNAFCWLMYGKPSTNAKNYSPKTAGTHGLNHVVEMVVRVENPSDGNPPYSVKLKKDYHEVYKTQRGSTEKKLDGHTTDYFIDDVPIGTEKEFHSRLMALIRNDDIAKILTRYNYFLEDMSVKDRRKLLLDMCGDITDADIIASDPALNNLPDIIGAHSVEEYLKIAAAQLKKINDEVKQIPNRIDEAERAKPEGQLPSKAEAENLMKEAQERLNVLNDKRAALSATASADIRKEIAEVQADMAVARADHIKSEAAKNAETNDKVRALESSSVEIKRKIGSLDMEKEQLNIRIRNMENERAALLEQWEIVTSRVWSGDTKCPLCGQDLPEDQIEEKKAEFNRKNAQERETIQLSGQNVSESKIEDKKVQVAGLEQEIFKQQTALEEIQKNIAQLQGSTVDEVPFDETPFQNRITELQGRLSDFESALAQKTEEINALIRKEESELADARAVIANIELSVKQDERIAELDDRRKVLLTEGEELEHKISTCEAFNRRKAELLSDKINSRFKTLKFRLFKQQINGGIEDDCEALIPCNGNLVEFKDANNASRINAGLEVIDALSEFYNVALPVFIDNAESCVALQPTKAQQIRLYVSGVDKTLRTVYG